MAIATSKIKTIEYALNDLCPISIVEAMKIIREYDIPAQWEIRPVYGTHDPMSIRAFHVKDCRGKLHGITLKKFIKVKQYGQEASN